MKLAADFRQEARLGAAVRPDSGNRISLADTLYAGCVSGIL